MRLNAAVIATLVVALSTSSRVRAQTPLRDGAELRLWPGTAPGALGTTAADIPIVTE
ncbi:MAG: hypothetical protein ABI442_14960 [Gemmatimonadaceae bacterium]